MIMVNGKRPIVYICFPLSGEVRADRKKFCNCCRFALKLGAVPVKRRLFAVGEPELHKNMALLSRCNELWVFGRNITGGMAKEIRRAVRGHKKIRYFKEV